LALACLINGEELHFTGGLIYRAALSQLHVFVLNDRMSVTGELLRKLSWPNLKQCPQQLAGAIEESLKDL
jgi:hypothetical protein